MKDKFQSRRQTKTKCFVIGLTQIGGVDCQFCNSTTTLSYVVFLSCISIADPISAADVCLDI